MRQPVANRPAPPLVLAADTAADLMTPNPVSVRAAATVAEALALLTERSFSAAPVIDEAGRPVGVLSRTDLLIHRRQGGYPGDDTPVRAVMTPAVFSVAPDTPAAQVLRHLLGMKVHRLFVVDPDGVLIGVLTAFDVLRHLRPALEV
jgi:CBS domain-containing protein